MGAEDNVLVERVLVAVQRQSDRGPAELLVREVDRTEARCQIGCQRDVVVPDHGDVLGNSQAGLVECEQYAAGMMSVIANTAENGTPRSSRPFVCW